MKKILLIISFLFVALYLRAQQKAEKALNTLDEKYPQEKIHLFLNKESFNAGEIIRFKAYLFSGNVQSYISKTLYVELLDEQKQTVSRVLLPILDAAGEGSIALPADIEEGNYFLRAYTRWMLNFDERFQYLYHLPVYNQHSFKKLISKPVAWTAALYPESGTLLPGRDNKVAIRLSAAGTLPQQWQGYIAAQDGDGKVLINFNSLNTQLAVFNIRPEAGKTYIAHVSDAAGNAKTISFQSPAQGVSLKARQQEQLLKVEINTAGMEDGVFNYKLVAASYGQLLYSGNIQKKDSLVRIAIPVNKLLPGVVQLTLFNSNEIPVAERLVFIQTGSMASPKLTLSSTNTSDGLTEWKITGDPLDSNSTASIEATAAYARKRTIKSDLWLGDLSGDITEPAQYFAGGSVWVNALDALLITEKWTRYHWAKLLADSFPNITHQPEGYLSFSGIALKNKQPLKETRLSFLVKGKDSSFDLWQASTNKAGEFYLQDIAFFDSISVYHFNRDKNRSLQDIKTQWKSSNDFSAFTGQLPGSPLMLQERNKTGNSDTANTWSKQNGTGNKAKLLESVTVKAKTKTPTQLLDEKLSSALFMTEQQQVFDFVNKQQNAMAYNHIFDWLEGRVAGLTFTVLSEDRVNPITQSVLPAGERIPLIRDGIPAIFVDEILTDVANIHSLPIADIAMVKIIKGYFAGASGGGGSHGAIAIYTIRAGMMQRDKSVDIPAVVLAGYTPVVKQVDQQSYWNNHPFEGDGTGTNIRFASPGTVASLRLVITGFTKDARPVYYERVVRE